MLKKMKQIADSLMNGPMVKLDDAPAYEQWRATVPLALMRKKKEERERLEEFRQKVAQIERQVEQLEEAEARGVPVEDFVQNFLHTVHVVDLTEEKKVVKKKEGNVIFVNSFGA